jgi:outer membrane protein OmpA-like peptidoglycan-associated protein
VKTSSLAILVILCAAVAGTAAVVQAADAHLAQLPHAGSAVTVAHSRRGYERLQLPAGRMAYSEAIGNEGYFPERSLAVVAERRSRAVDYPAGITAFELGDRAETGLRERNYRIAYRCTGVLCGDGDGWRLFLGDAAAGDKNSQYYLLAWREMEGRNREYVQYYVADLHGRARLLLNTYVGQPLNDGPGDGPLPVYFATGSAALSLHAREALRDWVADAALEPDSVLEVTGYADPQGSVENNLALSQQRAASVARWLAADAALAGIRITTVAGGVDPGAGREGSHPLADGRRAEIRVLRGATSTQPSAICPSASLFALSIHGGEVALLGQRRTALWKNRLLGICSTGPCPLSTGSCRVV